MQREIPSVKDEKLTEGIKRFNITLKNKIQTKESPHTFDEHDGASMLSHECDNLADKGGWKIMSK